MPQICWFVISSILCGCGRVNLWPGPGQAMEQCSTWSGRWAYIIGQSPPPVNCSLTTLSAPGPASPVSSKIRADDGSLQRPRRNLQAWWII